MKYWYEKITKPIIGLAPMHGYTYSSFRQKCKDAGADVVYSEMVAAEAVIREIPRAMEMLAFNKSERPVVLQIFGCNADSMAAAAKYIEKKFKPDGIDINFGCPVQKAAKQGFGAVQLADPVAAAKIVKAVKGVLVKTALSVKIRVPNKNLEETMVFVEKVYRAGAGLIAVHGRSQTQKYRGEADWGFAYALKERFPDLYVLGNGDIKTRQDLEQKLGNLDGVLVGRAAKIRPEVFSELARVKVLSLK